MNRWMEMSIEYASQRSYLDDLYQVYTTIPEGIRDIDEDTWNAIEFAYDRRDNMRLMLHLLDLDLFPIKDSYIAYMKRDPSSIARNPRTVNRICGRLYEMGIDKLFERCSEPKETNRQIGPMFKNWVKNKSLGIDAVDLYTFKNSRGDAVLDASDEQMSEFASRYLGYSRNKGLDFVARFNNKYVIGEAKFLTDHGGHQNAQFKDAMSTLDTRGVNATIIAILDGVVYIKGKNYLYRSITEEYSDKNIMSSLVLREFLYSL